MTEDNELIAQFMGFEFIDDDPEVYPDGYWLDLPYCQSKDFEYHENWDWLMPVIEKIESIYDDFHGYFGVYISSNSCTIQGTKLNTTIENPHYAYYNSECRETKIESTYHAVVLFIKWYNQNN